MSETPHRRSDDFVSFRDMVEYVAESDARYHAARAESLMQINKSIENLERKLDGHEKWHRDILEGLLAARRQNGLAVLALIIASLAVLSTIAVPFLTSKP